MVARDGTIEKRDDRTNSKMSTIQMKESSSLKKDQKKEFALKLRTKIADRSIRLNHKKYISSIKEELDNEEGFSGKACL